MIPKIICSVSKCSREKQIHFGIKAICRFYITSGIYLRLLYFLIISTSSPMAEAALRAQGAEQLATALSAERCCI